MKASVKYISFLVLGFLNNTWCGAALHCGYSNTAKSIITTNHFSKLTFDSIVNNRLKLNRKYLVKLDSVYPIPIIFHFVLNSSQIQSIGGDAGILERIDSQVQIINRAFSNEDLNKNKIPNCFRNRIGSPGIRFGLAHQSPDGKPSPGYEIVVTSRNGFDLNGEMGSRCAFSDAKYTEASGISAWDPSIYLNIWIINPLDNGFSSSILSATIPPSYIVDFFIPLKECGIVMHYGSIGITSNPAQYNLSNRLSGGTLIHELGHFFNVNHLWGDDNGLCPYNGGDDDGLLDTPPQANFTLGCPNFPYFDGCVSGDTSNSVMYMNYMDYTDDTCRCMFTQQQAELMRANILSFGEYYALTKHPERLEYPPPETDQLTNNELFLLYPNPTNGELNLFFFHSSINLQQILVKELNGQIVFNRNIVDQLSSYAIRLPYKVHGIFILYLYFKDNIQTRKILSI